MVNSLDRLILQIRSTIPHPEAIHDVSFQPALDGLTFIWFGNTFFAKPTLEVFEIRGRTLYVTGNSLLLQSLISFESEQVKVLEEVSSFLNRAEDILGRRYRHEDGVTVLKQAHASLRRATLKTALH